MAVTSTPIFTQTPKYDLGAALATANTAVDGTGTVATICTAGANGAYLRKLRCRALGTNVATVLRVFLNNGSDPTVAANNALIVDFSLPASTASNAAAIAGMIDIPLNFAIPAGYRLTAVVGTTVASGWRVSCEYGDY